MYCIKIVVLRYFTRRIRPIIFFYINLDREQVLARDTLTALSHGRGTLCSTAFFSNGTMTIEIRPYKPSDEELLVQLWTDCGLVVPWNNPQRDIRRKLKVQPELFLVGCTVGHIIASVMAGYDGHRGWINYLAVHPNYQRLGIGRRIVEEAEARLNAMGCPKVNLQVRTTNTNVIEFYREIGYKIDDVVSLGKRLEPDN